MSSPSALLELAQALIARPSVSPDDKGCQALLAEQLATLGFSIEALPFGAVSNLWARYGDQAPLVCFAGHTDVVPAGNVDEWDSDPFQGTLRDGYLYGRGAADMKGSLAAMLVACANFLQNSPDFQGSIAFLITSDEEADAIDGTRKVIEVLEARQEKIDYCIVGEPSSTERLGDIVRNGRRGSLHGRLTVHGQAGHVAYPHLATNPIHAFGPALAEFCQREWDQGNDYFPATSMQISNIHAGEGVTNVIPGTLSVVFNFRFSTESSAESLQTRTEEIFRRHDMNFTLDWELSGNPFLTPEGSLTEVVGASIKALTDTDMCLSTGGGTSDGRFIAPTGAQLVELGPCNATIHKVNERVAIAELDQLALIYEDILKRLLNA